VAKITDTYELDTGDTVERLEGVAVAAGRAKEALQDASPNSEWKALLVGLAANVVAMLVVAFGKKLGLDLDPEQIMGIVGLALGGNYGVAKYTQARPAKGMAAAAKMRAATDAAPPQP